MYESMVTHQHPAAHQVSTDTEQHSGAHLMNIQGPPKPTRELPKPHSGAALSCHYTARRGMMPISSNMINASGELRS